MQFLILVFAAVYEGILHEILLHHLKQTLAKNGTYPYSYLCHYLLSSTVVQVSSYIHRLI